VTGGSPAGGSPRGGLAFLIAGQGAQHARMFEIVRAHDAAEAILAEARTLLGGRDPRDIAAAEDGARFGNRTGQILCCAAVAAVWSALAIDPTQPMTFAGYSVGELASWHCAGLFDAGTLLRLAARRAELMDAASADQEGRLLAVVGLGRAAIAAFCRDHGAEVAITNGTHHVVLGVAAARLDALTQALAAAGPAVLRVLPVAVASHTSALRAANDGLREVLRATPMASALPGCVRLLSGLDGEPVASIASGQDRLAAAISQRLDWAACLDAVRESGARTILELGPGTALAAMAREAIPDVRIHSIDDFRRLDGAAEWLAG
jgi:[acyl-carrier-protein] S-malonyltransferase